MQTRQRNSSTGRRTSVSKLALRFVQGVPEVTLTGLSPYWYGGSVYAYMKLSGSAGLLLFYLAQWTFRTTLMQACRLHTPGEY